MIEILENVIIEKRVIKASTPEEFEKYFVNRLRELAENNNIIYHDRDVSLNRLIPNRYEISYMPNKGDKDEN